MVGGEARQVTSRLGLRFEVVRAILTNAMTLSEGARKLRMRRAELEALVEGARRHVLAALSIPTEITDGASITNTREFAWATG